MPRIPFPGLRILTPRISLISRPILPITSRISQSRASTAGSGLFSWRTLTTASPRPYASPPPSPSPHPNSSGSDSGSGSGSGPSPGPGPNASLSARLKHLIKSYGWYALGVYLLLSTLDFTVAFGLINVLGAEHVARITDTLKSHLHHLLHSLPPEPGKPEYEYEAGAISSTGAVVGGGGGRESLYAMLVLAYTVHKTLFLPFRVGLTAMVTPRLVGWLGRRGWAGGEGAKRAAREMKERVKRNRDSD